ncbi:MAG: Beta-glucosidase [Promethearchaeota archaeon]|nr:MAG: Beta-glucosidase [Candidatus Lokiarchaeota archaeon]
MKFKDHKLPLDDRVKDLLSRLTIEEKISQLFNISTSIERLQIPLYDWRNECIHGVAFAGKATIFPQAIGLAATWDPELIHKVATIISDEARAKHHHHLKHGKKSRRRYFGLTFAAPNINIFRDPRWGRGQETFGEDPYLTSRLAVTFIQGLQGKDSRYFKIIAEPKHFAVHSGPELRRHEMDITVKKKDLYETYLPAFEAAIKEGKAYGVMGAYHRLNGKPCCASEFLLKTLLREEWDFKGYVIGDGGAVEDIHNHHKTTKSFSESAAMALKAGCDVINPMNILTKAKIKSYQKKVFDAYERGNITEKDLDKNLTRSLKARFLLGFFDPPEKVPYSKLSYDIVGKKAHRKVSLKAAEESTVLLKNRNTILPILEIPETIAVIGPNADNIESLKGDYSGKSSKYVTPLQGIKNKFESKAKILYEQGSMLTEPIEKGIKKSIQIAKQADIIICCLGLSPTIEGEEGHVITPLRGDRKDLQLPAVQKELLKALYLTQKPIILILLNGGCLAVTHADKYIDAILEAWYPGEEGGTAIANVLSGDYNPSGKLPITFYRSIDQLPDYEDYSMEGRTYRFFDKEPLYPFGYGLSYSSFKFKDLSVNAHEIKQDEDLKLEFTIVNEGPYDGEDIAQLYIKHQPKAFCIPKIELKRFKRVHLANGRSKTVSFILTSRDFSLFDEQGLKKLFSGRFTLFIGDCQPTKTNMEEFLTEEITIKDI